MTGPEKPPRSAGATLTGGDASAVKARADLASDVRARVGSERPPFSLRSLDPVLRDLARGSPLLVEAVSGRATGAHLVGYLGAGGMSTVFAAQLDPGARSNDLSPLTPRRFAVKFMQLATHQQFTRMNLDPSGIFLREVVALSRVMERRPPTEFVVGFYGSGHADVEVSPGDVRRLPWLAIEHVEGGLEGVTLAERVDRATGDGVDPIRALRLLRGIFSGVLALHSEGIIHRDLKPENVLIAGPVDDETPKLADCGIARVEGLLGTVAGMTPAYGGSEQILSVHGVRNPLVGTWTDVHALAAVAWFILGGADWCRSETDPDWHAGRRRSLRTAPRVHPAFVWDPGTLEQLDAVLARGASPRLPEMVWERKGASDYARAANASIASPSASPRYATAEALQAELFPLLERCAAAWTARAGLENRAATAFRPTQLVRSASGLGDEVERATVRELPPIDVSEEASPGACVFQPDGRVLARFGDRLVYFIDDEAHKVTVPPEHVRLVVSSTWLVRGPGGGFALVGPSHLLLIRGGRFAMMPPPERGSAEVGEIQAVIDDGRTFGVVTAETDDSNGGPELWRSSDGTGWGEPVVLPLSGDARSVAFGPYGFLVVGDRRGTRARALFLGFDNQPVVYVVGVNDKPPLEVAVCSAGREGWAAGKGVILAFDRGAVREEPVDCDDSPVALGLDLVGSPWLLTPRRVLRRHVHSGMVVWRVYHHRSDDLPPFIGFGFTPEGVRVLDARGGGVHLVPRDIESWKARATATQAS